MNKEDFIKGLFSVLTETFESSRDAESSIYLDRKIGVFETLDKLTAEQASGSITPQGTSLAAHAEHLRFYVAVLNESLTSDTEAEIDWAESWRVKTVTEEDWNVIRKNLKNIYETTKTNFQTIEDWDDEKISESIAIVAHTAYHFGSIRQILKTI